MAQTDLDGGQPEGTAGSPNSAGSQGQGDSSGSFDAAKLQTALEALTNRLDEVDRRSKALQGDKDRGITGTKKEVDELKRKFAEIEKLKKSGLDEDTAFDEMSFREDVRNLRQEISKLNPAQPQAAGNGETLAVDTAKVIANYQLDGNDPEVVEKVLKGNFTNPEQAELAALRLAYKRSNPQAPSPAGATSLQGSVSHEKDTQASLQAEYEKRKAGVRRGDIMGMSKLKADLRKKGWVEGA